jgi:hypothetical protein
MTGLLRGEKIKAINDEINSLASLLGCIVYIDSEERRQKMKRLLEIELNIKYLELEAAIISS